MIDWIGNHLKEYDFACKGYYGKNARRGHRERLEKRLDDPLYMGALPLYLFNLRSFHEYKNSLTEIIKKYSNGNRRTLMNSIEIINQSLREGELICSSIFLVTIFLTMK